MNRYFEVMDKEVNGEKLTRYNAETGEAVIVKWDVTAPVIEDNSKFVEIKTAEDVVIPSIWKGFMGVANTGINNFANKLNNLFGSTTEPEDTYKDYNASFRAVTVHTGLRAVMQEDEILSIYNANVTNGVLMAGGTQLYTDSDKEVQIVVYNVFPKDVLIRKGQTIALGVFQKVLSENNSSVDLNK